MKVFCKSKSNNYIVSIAIGQKHKNDWTKFCKDNWLNYCKKNDLGLIIFFKDLISKNNKFWKKPNWQKLLIGEILQKSYSEINNVCFLDIDILINYHLSPNIFNFHNENKISVISERKIKGLNLKHTLKQIAFNRNYYYSKKYLLESSLFMTPKENFKYHSFNTKKIKSFN